MTYQTRTYVCPSCSYVVSGDLGDSLTLECPDCGDLLEPFNPHDTLEEREGLR
jgi:rubredoxin